MIALCPICDTVADYEAGEWAAVRTRLRQRGPARMFYLQRGVSYGTWGDLVRQPAPPRDAALPRCRCQRGCCGICSADLLREAVSVAELPADWRTRRLEVLCRDGWRCRRCRSSGHLTVHHIKARADGGLHDLRNLLSLCVDCHNWAEIQMSERTLDFAELTRRPPDPSALGAEPILGAISPGEDLTMVVLAKVTRYRRCRKTRDSRRAARGSRRRGGTAGGRPKNSLDRLHGKG